MQTPSPLIRTKLHLPYIRPGLVSRPRLLERIAEGLRGPLTLITAPAGFGKTTLAACAVSNTGSPVAWLSLDKNDNQEWRFLSYLIAALQEADPAIGGEAAQLLAAAHRATPEDLLTSLVNDLGAVTGDRFLVLDDYQAISSQAVHAEVAFLLEHCPDTFHLVIATRSDPPLPLARLRAGGRLLELRTTDLRFTGSEAAQFLNDVMDLHIDAGAVEALEDRTEGWIAGLQMASIAMQSRLAVQGPLSMKAQEDIRGFIEGFSGTHHYIMDYLLEEVLAVQPPEIQEFLLKTSVLERFCAELCGEVNSEQFTVNSEELTVNNDEASIHTSPATLHRSPFTVHRLLSTVDCQLLVEHLDRSNLFLIPLDDERKWYRYHHLFADLLRARLQQILNSPEIAALHTRAGRWYEQHDLIYDAIHHASLISNMEWVERLIGQNYQEVFRRQELVSIRFLTGSLTREMVYRRPWLCIYEAESRAWFGEVDEADRLLAAAEKHIQSAEGSAGAQAMLGHLAYVQSRVTAMRGDIRRAIALCLTARENTPAGNQALQCGIGVMLGYGYFLDGDFPNAVQVLAETIQAGTAAGVISTTIAADCVLARVYAIQGQLQKAFQVYQEARIYAQAEGSGHRGGTGIVDVGTAAVLYEWNDLETALANITRGMEFISYWLKADDIALAYTTLARIQQAQGNLPAALESIEKASQEIRRSGVFWEAREAVLTAEIRIRLALGDHQMAGSLAGSLEKDFRFGESFRFGNELAGITLARVVMAQNKLEKCLNILAHLEANARGNGQAGGRTARLIEILLLKALAYQKTGAPARALETLSNALALAEPERFARVFLDEGDSMRVLLARWLAYTDTSPLRGYALGDARGYAQGYARHLLAQFAAVPAAGTSPNTTTPDGSKAQPANRLLLDLLSQRELEVLQLMALGKTNQEIARQLIVAPGTIKSHAASIYRKLDAANRTEAVARARQMGIIK